MEKRTVNYPIDSIAIVQMLSAFTGGMTVDVNGIVNEDVVSGSIVINDNGSVELLQCGVCQTAVGTTDTAINIYKGHTFKVGDTILAGEITEIDQSNEDYDVLSLDDAIGTIVALDEAIVNEGTNAIGVVIGSKVIKEDNTVDVGVMYRGEVNENVLINYFIPVDSDVKTALSHVVFS